MQSRSNFWLTLNDLAEDAMREGDTPAQRSANLAGVFQSLSHTSRAVYLANARIVLATLAPLADTMEATENSQATNDSPDIDAELNFQKGPAMEIAFRQQLG